jgi:hypothetical protein
VATQKAAKSPKKKPVAKSASPIGSKAKFPRHSVAKAIRIPQAILDQNAGKACSRADAAKFLGLGSPAGPFGVEISSALKYGLLEQPGAGQIQPSGLAKKILRPQSPNDTIEGIAKL